MLDRPPTELLAFAKCSCLVAIAAELDIATAAQFRHDFRDYRIVRMSTDEAMQILDKGIGCHCKVVIEEVKE